MSTTISPLAPKKYPKMPAIEGVRIATAEAGIKYKNRTDLLAMVFDAGTAVAGVFTKLEMPVGAGRFLPRRTLPPARRACWSSIPATPTPSPAGRAASRPR